MLIEKVKSISIITLGILLSFVIGCYYGKSYQEGLEAKKLVLLEHKYQVKENNLVESYILVVNQKQKEILNIKEKINANKEIINSTNHINSLWVQHASGSKVSNSTKSNESEDESISDFESIPDAARVALYVAELKNHDDLCVSKYNMIIDFYSESSE